MAELRAASRDRRAVEILKERRFEDWRREQDRREQAELDEIAVIRGSRRLMETS
jgi:flagellar export protein FliJ